MGKRTDFKRIERDFYATPVEAVMPLTPYIRDVRLFAEPFVGNGAIVDALKPLGYECLFACDIQPEGAARQYATVRDVMDTRIDDYTQCDAIITNPPWPRPRTNGEPTLGFLRHLMQIKPTWVLLAADFMHNVYAADLMMLNCDLVVSVGRVSWMNNKVGGFDNAAWYRFTIEKSLGVLPGLIPIQRPIPNVPARDSIEAQIRDLI